MDSNATALEQPFNTSELVESIASTLPPIEKLAETLAPTSDLASSRRASFVATLAQPAAPVDRYETGSLLGKGGMGVVVNARDRDLARSVALKQLQHKGAISASDVARFLREAQVTAQLEHPGVVPIYDLGRDETGQFYYVMRLVRGGMTLRSLIERLQAGDEAAHREYPIDRRVRIGHQVAQIVGYAHSKGVIHRDLKPENIMIGPFGQVYVIDWGLAKVTGDADVPATPGADVLAGPVTAVGAVAGTPHYMAPEQARGEVATPLSDVYSLSATLYELFSLHHYLGKNPPRTMDKFLQAVIHHEPIPAENHFGNLNGRVPRAISFACAGGMAKDPAERFQSMAELEKKLDRYLQFHIPIYCPATLLLWGLGKYRRAIDRRPALVTLSTFVFPSIGLIVYGAISLWRALR